MLCKKKLKHMFLKRHKVESGVIFLKSTNDLDLVQSIYYVNLNPTFS